MATNNTSNNTSREISTQADQSYWAIVKRQFKKNKLAVWSLRIIILIITVGLLADFLANDKPLYCSYKGNTYFPVIKEYAIDMHLSKWPEELNNVVWKDLKYDAVVFAPIPYAPEKTDDKNNDYKSPMGSQEIVSTRWRHWLGTDQLGRDLLSGLIHGTRIAMLVGVVSMSIASVIGILLGSLAGYYGDEKLKISLARLILNIIGVPLAMFYAFNTRGYILEDALADSFGSFCFSFLVSFFFFLILMLIPNIITIGLKKIPFLDKKVTIPVDILISRMIEVIMSIPTLLLILSICAIVSKPSIMLIMVIIGLTGWTGIAKLIRGELLKVRSLEFIEAAQSLGYSEARILFKHAIPNSLTPVLISIAFGVAGAILAESSLSFLGIGTQADVITWGKLLSSAREYAPAWWLAIFPGFAIFVTVTIFNFVGEGLTDAIDPRLKQ
ncbi:MAG: ABC transporter permease [Bacteroidota bacterium]